MSYCPHVSKLAPKRGWHGCSGPQKKLFRSHRGTVRVTRNVRQPKSNSAKGLFFAILCMAASCHQEGPRWGGGGLSPAGPRWCRRPGRARAGRGAPEKSSQPQFSGPRSPSGCASAPSSWQPSTRRSPPSPRQRAEPRRALDPAAAARGDQGQEAVPVHGGRPARGEV